MRKKCLKMMKRGVCAFDSLALIIVVGLVIVFGKKMNHNTN